MDILLVIFYTILFCFVIGSKKVFRAEGLSKLFLISVFLLKCLAGIAYCYLHIQKYNGGDTLQYFNDSNIIFNTLFEDPKKYFYLTFGPNGGTPPEYLKEYINAMGYWGDTGAYMVVRFNALVHLFSFGNFYVHSVFASFISLTGLFWLYKAVIRTTKYNFWFKVGTFLIPSVVFWTSGVHKESLLAFGLGLFFLSIVQLKKQFIKNLLLVILSAIFIFLVRDYILMLLIPGLIACAIAGWRPKYAIPIFIVIYMLGITLGSIVPTYEGKTLLELIAYKQELFKSLKAGNTDIGIQEFTPTLKSLFLQFPGAVKNSLLGPFFMDLKSPLHVFAMMENVLILAGIAICLLYTDFKNFQVAPLALWMLFFSLTLFTLIGYIVPNVGAIVRYRSLALPFLFVFLTWNLKERR